MSEGQLEPTQPGQISRRTLAKGVAWAVPAVAIASAAPAYASSVTTTTTTLPPCLSDISAVGGSYPVTYPLSGCGTANSHWDFRFRITAATQDGTDCDCPYLRVTLFDNPKRSRLWIYNQPRGMPDPSTNTNDSPRLYVQKVLAAGTSAEFPATGDTVHRVAGSSPWDGWTTGGSTVGTITAWGTPNDTVHVLMLPNGSIPCDASGPMAYYQVECGPSVTGPWTQLGGIGQINPCVPMIQSTVCRFNTPGNVRYRLGISVLTSCGIPASSFKITNIQRNNDTNDPTGGTSVWSGTQALGTGVTNINTTSIGSGGQLWITFTTDNVNFSQIRVPTSNTSNCPTTFSEDDQVTQPEGEQMLQSEGEQITPSGGESVAPSGGESVAPSGGESVAPSGGESVAPSGGESVAPSGGESVAPSGTESAAVAEVVVD